MKTCFADGGVALYVFGLRNVRVH